MLLPPIRLFTHFKIWLASLPVKVGAAKLRDDLTLNWGGIQGFRIAGKQGIGIIAACQLVLMGGPEYAR